MSGLSHRRQRRRHRRQRRRQRRLDFDSNEEVIVYVDPTEMKSSVAGLKKSIPAFTSLPRIKKSAHELIFKVTDTRF